MVKKVQNDLLIEKGICDHWKISIKLPCICVCLLSGDLFIFSIKVSSFFSYFLCYRYFSTFLPTWSLILEYVSHMTADLGFISTFQYLQITSKQLTNLQTNFVNLTPTETEKNEHKWENIENNFNNHIFTLFFTHCLLQVYILIWNIFIS